MQRPQQYRDHTPLPTANWLRQLGCLLGCYSGLDLHACRCASCPLRGMHDKVHPNSWLTKLVLGTAAPCQQKREDQHQCAVWRHAAEYSVPWWKQACPPDLLAEMEQAACSE